MPHLGSFAALCALCAFGVFSSAAQLQQPRARRQIFREQVLPQTGGKIPDEAFRTDRLALNRLNKEGIAIPDGVLLETRHREAHFQSHRQDPDIDASIIRLVQRPDGRYAPPEGRYPFNNLVESTYVIRPPINLHGYRGLPPRKPIPSTLQLPARPFFASDDDLLNINNLDNIELINTLSQEFPGTRLWTGFGPLFHETTNRILRHSGAKQLPSKRGDSHPGNHLLRKPEEKHQQKANLQTLAVIGRQQSFATSGPTSNPTVFNKPQIKAPLVLQKVPSIGTIGLSLQSNGVSKHVQSTATSITPSSTSVQNAGVSSPAGVSQSANRSEVRTLQLVNGILTSVIIPSREPAVKSQHSDTVQPLRPGPGLTLKAHLTAPPLGYPSLDGIPKTSFDCRKATRQMESDPQTNCQVFHLCHPDGRKESFLCPSGSRYDVKTNLCSPWTNVPCPANP